MFVSNCKLAGKDESGAFFFIFFKRVSLCYSATKPLISALTLSICMERHFKYSTFLFMTFFEWKQVESWRVSGGGGRKTFRDWIAIDLFLQRRHLFDLFGRNVAFKLNLGSHAVVLPVDAMNLYAIKDSRFLPFIMKSEILHCSVPSWKCQVEPGNRKVFMKSNFNLF